LLHFAVLRNLLESELIAYHSLHLQHFGDLLFRQEIDLQIQVIAMLGALAHAVLFHQDRCGQQTLRVYF